jgi:hypothetical protein
MQSDTHRLATFKRNAMLPFQTDQLQATLLDLYGISVDNAAFANSLLSDRYAPVNRVCDTMTD